MLCSSCTFKPLYSELLKLHSAGRSPWTFQDNSTKFGVASTFKANVITYADHCALLTSSSPWTRSCVVLPPFQTNHLTATRCAPFAFTWRIFTIVPGSFGIPSVFTMSPTCKIGFPHASRFLIVVPSTLVCSSLPTF